MLATRIVLACVAHHACSRSTLSARAAPAAFRVALLRSLVCCAVQTDTCFYTELRIYPGHGRRLIRRDGRVRLHDRQTDDARAAHD